MYFNVQNGVQEAPLNNFCTRPMRRSLPKTFNWNDDLNRDRKKSGNEISVSKQHNSLRRHEQTNENIIIYNFIADCFQVITIE